MIILLSFQLKNRKITLKIAKPAKSGTREYVMLRNINAFDNLSAKMSDSDDFLAGMTFTIPSLQCVGTMWGAC